MRTLSIALLLVLAAALTSCGSSHSTQNNQTDGSATSDADAASLNDGATLPDATERDTADTLADGSAAIDLATEDAPAGDLADSDPGDATTDDLDDVADDASLTDLVALDDSELGDLSSPLDVTFTKDAIKLDVTLVKDVSVVPICQNDAVYLSSGKLRSGLSTYATKTMNYIFQIRREVLQDKSEVYYIAPHHAYCADNRCCGDEASCLAALRADLKTLAELGFNSLRMVGLAIVPVNGTLSLECLTNVAPDKIEPCTPLTLQTPSGPGPQRDLVFGLIEKAVAEMKSAGLKGILHAGHHELDIAQNASVYAQYLGALAARFAKEPTLIGIDLWNEPPYQANDKNLSKAAINALVRSWYSAIRAQSSQLLVTIGLTDGDTVFNWDPAIVPVDFVSFHPYPNGAYDGPRKAIYERDMQWFATLAQPWIIGETGFAVGDWGDEAMQKSFAEASLALTRDCGGQGFSWWTYQDLHWGALEHFGLLRWDESQRPAAALFAGFDLLGTKGSCPTAPEPFNPNGYSAFTIKGRVVDENGKPVPNARIRGWRCPDWSGALQVTFSAADGTFTLSSDVGLVHVQITAAGMSIDTNIWPDCKSVQLGDRKLTNLNLDTSVATPNSCPKE